jgi:hypothetical protein
MNGMNPGNNAQNRWQTVKAILLAIDDAKIYGDWREDFVPQADHVMLNCGKFGGVVPKTILDQDMKTWRFTLLSPTGKGWVTAKFYECLMAGVLPLFGPDYDTQKHLNVPKTMRLPDLRAETIRGAIERLRPVREAVIASLRAQYLTVDAVTGYELADRLMTRLDPDHVTGPMHPNLPSITDDILAETAAASAGLDFLV